MVSLVSSIPQLVSSTVATLVVTNGRKDREMLPYIPQDEVTSEDQ